MVGLGDVEVVFKRFQELLNEGVCTVVRQPNGFRVTYPGAGVEVSLQLKSGKGCSEGDTVSIGFTEGASFTWRYFARTPGRCDGPFGFVPTTYGDELPVFPSEFVTGLYFTARQVWLASSSSLQRPQRPNPNPTVVWSWLLDRMDVLDD